MPSAPSLGTSTWFMESGRSLIVGGVGGEGGKKRANLTELEPFEKMLALMCWPTGSYPAGRTNKEGVLCCVDKQGRDWRSACGRSLVSFYPGWDRRLETD